MPLKDESTNINFIMWQFQYSVKLWLFDD